MERTHDEEIHKRINHVIRKKDLCVGGTFTRCNQNQVNTFGKQRVSSQTVGESKEPWKATLSSKGNKLGK